MDRSYCRSGRSLKHSNANSGPAIAQNSSAAILVRTKGNGHTSTMLTVALAHMRYCAYNVAMDSTITLLAALAEPTRLAATRILWDGSEHCVCELMAKLGASQSRMSRHMSVLKAAGLVTDRRDAQWVRYAAESSSLARIQCHCRGRADNAAGNRKESRMSVNMATGTRPAQRPAAWIAATAAAAVLWFAIYSQLEGFVCLDRFLPARSSARRPLGGSCTLLRL